jgi:hypothetical protein
VCFVVLRSSQDHLRTGTCDLDHPISCRCKKYQQLACQEGDLQHGFASNVSMVPSSTFIAATGGEHLPYDVSSLSETICFASLEFISGRFIGLSLSPLETAQALLS